MRYLVASSQAVSSNGICLSCIHFHSLNRIGKFDTSLLYLSAWHFATSHIPPLPLHPHLIQLTTFYWARCHLRLYIAFQSKSTSRHPLRTNFSRNKWSKMRRKKNRILIELAFTHSRSLTVVLF